MFYQNRFDTKDMIHHLYYFLQAFCALILACSLSADHTGHWNVSRNLRSFAIAAAVSRLLHALLYGQIYPMTIKFRTHIITLMTSQGVSSIIYILAAFSNPDKEDYLFFFLSALLLERLLSQIMLTLLQAPILPWHIHHLFSREVIFFIISSHSYH